MKFRFNKVNSQKIPNNLRLFFYTFCLWLSISGTVSAQFVDKVQMEVDPVFDGQVLVREIGDSANETVVLVHGLGTAASSDWEKTITELKKQYYIITFDLPGFGKSSKGNKDYTPTKYAALIRNIISNYNRKSFHLVGHSMGGAIALRYISKYPEDVKTLTLIDAAGLLHRLAYTKFLAPIGLEKLVGIKLLGSDKISNFVGTIMSKLERKLPIDALVSNAMIRDNVLNGDPSAISALNLVMEDFSDVPAKVKVPTLIIWGDKDDVAPIRTGYMLHSMIANSEMRVISGAGHVPIKNNFHEYINYLKKHLLGDLGKTANSKAQQGHYQGDITCSRKKSVYYTGNIGRLTLTKCKKVIIENAHIEQLIINRSQVTIKNTHIVADGIALSAIKSTVEITGGSISGDVAIKTSAGKYDIAGTKIIATKTAIDANRAASFIFSMSSINSKPIHGLKVVSYNSSFGVQSE